MPPAPLPASPVRTAIVIQSARMPEVMNTFSPSITQSPPSRRAVVRTAATSEPPPGSVMASAAILLAAQHRRNHFLLHLGPAVAQHRRQADVQREQAGQHTAAAAVARHGRGQRIAQRERRRRSAQCLRIAQAQQAERGRLAVQLAREFAVLLPLRDMRRDAFEREAPDGVGQRLDVLLEFGIHVATSNVTSSCDVAACWPAATCTVLTTPSRDAAKRVFELHRFEHQQRIAAADGRARLRLHGDHLAVERRAQFMRGCGAAGVAGRLERGVFDDQIDSARIAHARRRCPGARRRPSAA